MLRRLLDALLRRRRPPPVPGSYSIACTLKEPPEIVAAFVAHHLTLDVDRIYLFLDGPDPEVEAQLAGLPRCQVTVCNRVYWWLRHRVPRPGVVVRRQLLNAGRALRLMPSEWLLHIDADEYLVPEGPLRPHLAAVPRAHAIVRLRNFERFLPAGEAFVHLFQGRFRGRIPKRQFGKGEMFGAAAPFLARGLSGYVNGKTASRRGTGRRLTLHAFPTGDDENDTIPDLPGVSLLHFDGFTPLHWVSKVMRKAASGARTGRARRAQAQFLQHARDGATRRSLFTRVNVIDAATSRTLAEMKALRDIDFDPRPAVRATFPRAEFDFSPEAFDRRLIAADPDWFRRMDLAP